MMRSLLIVVPLLLGAAVKTGGPSPTSDVSNNRATATGATTARSIKEHLSTVIWASNYAATGAGLYSAAETASITGRTLVITAPITITTAVGTISVPVRFEGGGKLILNTGGSVTLSGALTAPLTQIFDTSGGGTLTFSAKVDHVVPQWWGAVGDGVTDDTAEIQAAIGSGKGYVLIPDGTYLVTSPITVPSNIIIQFSQGAKFIAGANSLIFFRSTTSAYYAQIRDANLDGNGKTGVTGFDLVSFRVKSALVNPFMTGMEYGIILRQLCWDTVIDNPKTQTVTYPLIIKDGSNAVDVRHPAFDTGTTGIQVITGPTYDTTDVRITGGYVQGFSSYGITDSAISTKIDGTYFESCTTADIYFASSIRGAASRTGHWLGVGAVAIKGRDSTGVTIFDPTMGSGNRSTGLYDFDGSNGNCTEWHTDTSDSKNTPVGTTTGLSAFVAETVGTFTPIVKGSGAAGAGTYTAQQGTYRIVGKLISFHATITWTAHTGTGNVVFAGLPTTAYPSNYAPRRVVHVVPNFAFTDPVLYAYLNGTNADATLVQVAVAGTESLVPLPAAGTLHIFGAYELQ